MLKRTIKLTKDELDILVDALEYEMWMMDTIDEVEHLHNKLQKHLKKIQQQEKALERLPEITPRDPESH